MPLNTRDGVAEAPTEPGARTLCEPWDFGPAEKLWRLIVPWKPLPFEVPEILTVCPTSKASTVTVEAFAPGEAVKVSGISKGKGFAGTIKRHNFASGPKSHGSHNVRAPGSIGASADPARVFKGIRGPGQMGNKRATQRGLEVVDIRDNLLLLRGSVPGPKGGVVEIRSDV